MVSMPRRLLSVTILLAAALVAACDSVGDGNSLKELRLVPSGQSPLESYAETRVYECFRSQLVLYGFFDDGSGGAISGGTLYRRDVKWTSSNPNVVRVSNVDEEPIPGGEEGAPPRYYPDGYLTPVAASDEPVTITAEYLGLTTSIQVTVGTPTDFKLEPANARIAPMSTQGFVLSAKLDGIERALTEGAAYEFVEDNDEVAMLSFTATGAPVVIGVGAGGPLTLRASFDACPQVLEASVSVAEIQSLQLAHEEGFSGELVQGTSERVKVMADFGDGPEQDLTGQSAYDSADASLVAPAGNGILLATAAGNAVEVKAVFGRLDDGDEDHNEEGETPGIASNGLPITVVAGTLTDFSIAPESATIEGLKTQQFTATGVFDNGARTQPITRHVAWDAVDVIDGQEADADDAQTVAAVGTGVSPSAGLAVSLLNEPGVAHIKAKTTVGEAEQTRTATLTVVPVPGTVPTPAPEQP